MYIIISIIVAYLLGSLPYGLILVKVFKNIDIRTMGSKNIGATNVLRAGFPILAVFTMLLDIFKGVLAVLFAKMIGLEVQIVALCGLIATIGHVFPIWLKFSGGKGVATGFGAILFLNPTLGGLALGVWILVLVVFRYSSLSAISACIFIAFYSIILMPTNYIYCFLIVMLILFKHKANFIRLINKEEKKINFKKK
jgi:glycerol-3-phosphate acyltransferase PlsY